MSSKVLGGGATATSEVRLPEIPEPVPLLVGALRKLNPAVEAAEYFNFDKHPLLEVAWTQVAIPASQAGDWIVELEVREGTRTRPVAD